METDLIHRDELRCRAEAWVEDVFAGEPDNCKYNSLLYLIDDSEVVGVADVETEKLIAALRETQSLGDAPVGLFWGVIVTKELVKECIDALERLTAESAEKDAEIERLKKHTEDLRLDYCDLLADRDRLQTELDAAVEDLEGAGACFTCKHFRRNGGDCFGAGRCRLDGIEIWPCNEPGVYRVEVPDDGRKMYEWRGPQEAGNGVVE